MANWEIRAENIEVIRARYEKAPRTVADFIEKNLRTAGTMIAAKERRVLKVVKYRGTLARSINTAYEANPPIYRITIGPLVDEDKHAIYVLLGTKPHWAPIGPLKDWAKWKLGDEKAAYAVQASIAHHGTSVGIERKGLGDGHGGYNYVQKTLERGDVQRGLQRTSLRIPIDVATFLNSGQTPAAPAAEGGE